MAIDPDVLKMVTLEDFTGDLKLIAEQVGMDVALDLYERCSGLTLYFPKSGLDDFKRRFIAENRNKYSPKELAVMLGVTEKFVYSILAGEKMAQRQLGLFPESE